MTSEAPVHLLLAGIALPGHLNPLLQLASFLTKRRATHPDCYITLCLLTHDEMEVARIIRAHERIRVITESGFDMNGWFQDMQGVNNRFADKLAPKLQQFHPEWPAYDAVVFDFVSTYGSLIADMLNLPSFVYLTSPLICIWSVASIYCLTSRSDPTEYPTYFSIPSLGDFPLPPLQEPRARRMSSNMSANCISGFRKARGCLVNDISSFYPSELLESRPPEPVPQDWSIFCIGPLCLQDPRVEEAAQGEADKSVSAFLDRHPPRSVLYIALGSSASLAAEDFHQLVTGIAVTKRPFILVHGKAVGASNGPPASASSTIQRAAPPDALPPEFQLEVQDRGLIVEWVNQPRVLSHKSVGAFLTHCGWNSVTEAIALGGMPFVLLPLRGDQIATAGLLSIHLKCGKLLRLPPQAIEAGKVREVIEEVFTDQEMCHQANELHQLALCESVNDGTADRNITKFLFHVMQLKVNH